MRDIRRLSIAYGEHGLVVLAFPNTFAETKDISKIRTFFQRRGFNLPNCIAGAKCEVNGRRTSPVFRYLKAASGDPQFQLPWAWVKYLVACDGQVLGPWMPRTRPAVLEPTIRLLLGLDPLAGTGLAPPAPLTPNRSSTLGVLAYSVLNYVREAVGAEATEGGEGAAAGGCEAAEPGPPMGGRPTAAPPQSLPVLEAAKREVGEETC